MASEQGAGGSPDGFRAASLTVDPLKGLALLEVHDPDATAEGPRVLFDGIALGAGVYLDAADRRIRITAEHLPLVAERVQGVFLRDLHREDMAASVGVVAAARLEDGEVRFIGDVRLAPYVELIRHFWRHIRFSLGFRYDPARLVANRDGTFDLPPDFLVDHLALVPQGQYPNARLVRLLNQARGLAPVPAPGAIAPCGIRNAPSPSGGTSMTDASSELDQLRKQRDHAVETATQANAAAEAARNDLGKTRADLEAANRLAAAARLELGQAKNRLAAEVMKLELGAGKDFDLDHRKQELTGLDLAALDRLRGELRLSTTAAGADDDEPAPPGPRTVPAGPASVEAASHQASRCDLQAMGLNDALRLALQQGVF